MENLNELPQRFAARFSDDLKIHPWHFGQYFSTYLSAADDLKAYSGPTPTIQQCEDTIVKCLNTSVPGLHITVAERIRLSKELLETLPQATRVRSPKDLAAIRQPWLDAKLDASRLYKRNKLATRAGVEFKTIDNWYKGKSNFSRETAEYVAEALGVPVTEILALN